jgi:hypothetical protein
MSRVAMVLAGLVVGYVLGALLGVGLVEAFSGNRHDKSLEAVMTGAFVTGPLGAVLGAIGGLVWGRGSGASRSS